MFIELIQTATKKRSAGFAAYLRHLGAFDLFSLAILDSLPFPYILIAILAARHHDPWYEYAAAATTGSLIGAVITFRLARRAGLEYLNKHFGSGRVPRLLKLFEIVSSWVDSPRKALECGSESYHPFNRFLMSEQC